MKIVFFGTGEFAVPALEELAKSVILVVSQPAKPSGRGLQPKPSHVALAAETLGLPVETPEKCREPQFVERISELHADALVVAAYGQILPEPLLNAAKKGAINLHGSILPKYRGAAPIQRAILEGQTETGVTLMQMDIGMDTGDIIAVRRTPIGPDETYSQLQTRLAQIAAELCREWMPKIVAGDYPRQRQLDDEATLAPKVSKADAELSLHRSADRELCRFRAFTDSPGAWIRTTSGILRIRDARLSQASGPPGSVLSVKPQLSVAFAEGAMDWLQVQPQDKKTMSGAELANGWRLKPGDSLI